MTISKTSRLLAGMLFLSAGAFAAGAGSPLDAKLTIQVTAAPLAQFLDTLSAQTKTSFVLTEDADKARVTLDVKDKKASDILAAALEGSGFTSQRSGKSSTYLILTKAQSASYLRRDELLKKNKALDSRVTVAVTGAPLNVFLETVSAQTHASFTLAPGLEKYRVTLDLRKATARDALGLILTMKGLEIVQNGANGFTIKPG